MFRSTRPSWRIIVHDYKKVGSFKNILNCERSRKLYNYINRSELRRNFTLCYFVIGPVLQYKDKCWTLNSGRNCTAKFENQNSLIIYSNSFIHSFIHSVDCLPLPNRIPHPVRSSASSLNFQYPPPSLRSCGGCLRLLPRRLVIFILSSIFPSITCFRRQFLRKMCQFHLAILLFIVRTIFHSSFAVCNTSSILTWSVQITHFKPFQVLFTNPTVKWMFFL
jgi:hypothetical protein